MGQFLQDLRMTVALLMLPEPTADRISERFARRGENDPGQINSIKYSNVTTFWDAIERDKIRAICISFRALHDADLVTLIAKIRFAHPLISICLVGTQAELTRLANFNKACREHLEHYYKIFHDATGTSLDDSIDLVRDLFVADAIKVKALGHYDTKPGGIVRLRRGQPLDYWVLVVIPLAAALVGAFGMPALQLLGKLIASRPG